MRLNGTAILLAAAAVMAACAGTVVAKEVRSELRVHVGDKAPDFTLTASDGKRVRLSSFAGRIVLLDFYRGHW
ncbi:MAG: redoxin domain-containing protein [Acidobacteria bacterium]|nr:redoxin domain-containing protein [Acidobacteriota bacterium]